MRSPKAWPTDYSVLAAAPPPGWRILDNVLDPLVIVSRDEDGFVIGLAARLRRRTGTTLLYAPSLACNWVCGGDLICPLPRDVPSLVRAALAIPNSHPLTFPQVIALARTRHDGFEVELDESILTSANAEADQQSNSIEVPGLNATLYGYQSKGIRWMRAAIRRTGGVVLADEMGLGKTIQIIGLLLLDLPSQARPALIVCPTTLIANWVRELARFAPSLEVAVHRGPDRGRLPRHLQKAQVLITTYDTLVNDLVLVKAIEWSWLICDEAQAIKNPDSQRRRAIAEVPRLRAIPVTGTPVENHLTDLWSLADVAIPGLLGSQAWFEREFDDSDNSARRLSVLTNPIVLKRQVCDVAQDLPERIDVVVPLELGSVLAEEYEVVRQQTLEKYPAAGALVATGQLQLFCAHPSLRTVMDDGVSDSNILGAKQLPAILTPKLERTIQLLDEAFLRRRKVILFSNFNACGPLIRAASGSLPTAYWGAINGSTPSAERQLIVDAFSAHDGAGVLVLNPRAAGAGLNITAATIVIHFTQVWNPALELQASARAYRRGQTQPVTIYHMFYVDTVEEVMMERAQRRRLMGAEAVPVTSDRDDLAKALSLSPVGVL